MPEAVFLEWFDNRTDSIAGDLKIPNREEHDVRGLLGLPKSEEVRGVTFPVPREVAVTLSETAGANIDPDAFEYFLTIRSL